MDEEGWLKPASTIHYHVVPFEGAVIHKEALEFNGIRDPFSPLRGAVSEETALKEIYKQIRKEQKPQAVPVRSWSLTMQILITALLWPPLNEPS